MRPPLPSVGRVDGASANAAAEFRASWKVAAEGIGADDGVNEILSAGTRAGTLTIHGRPDTEARREDRIQWMRQ